MYRTAWLPLIVVLAIALVGCGGTPATPTKPPATTAPQVITVVVTAPPPPVTPTSSQPTITAMPTVALTVTTPIVVAPTGTTGTPRPAATRRPATATATAARPTATTLPNKYRAPVLISPNFDPNGRRDQLAVGSALILEWQSVGSLGEGECYRLRIEFNPGGADTFLQCAPEVTGAGVGVPVRYVLQRPGFAGLNYGGILGPGGPNNTASWSVDVVKDDGPAATGPIAPDGVRHKVTALSPRSLTFTFPVF